MCRRLADIPTPELEQLAAKNSQHLARSLGTSLFTGIGALAVTGPTVLSLEPSTPIPSLLIVGVVGGIISAFELAEFAVRDQIRSEYEAALRRRCNLD